MEVMTNIFIPLFFIINTHRIAAGISLGMDTSSSTVSQGTEARFDCYSSNIPQNFFELGGRVEWTRYPLFSHSAEVIARWTRENGGDIRLDDPDEQYTLEGGSQGSRLDQRFVIRHAKKSDQGSYRCAILNSTGLSDAQSNSITLTVKYPPAHHYPVCTAVPEEVGENIKLRCESEKTSPLVSLQWYRGNVKVADGMTFDHIIRSTYVARPDEFGSQFECRLMYDDGAGIEVYRECQFSRPNIIVSFKRISSRGYQYHAFAHSSPPFVKNLTCTVESSPANIPTHFRQEFPGYGTLTIPVDDIPQRGNIICRAQNVFGETNNVTLISRNNLTTQFSLDTTIWPRQHTLVEGENATFGCSYSLKVNSPVVGDASPNVDISWKYNENPIGETQTGYVIENNMLHVSALPKDVTEATITCVAVVTIDGTPTGTPIEISAVITLGAGQGKPCAPQPMESVQGKSATDMVPFIVGVSILGVALLILVIILTSVLWKKGKSHKAPYSDGNGVLIPHVTYRADPTAGIERLEQASNTGTIQRALPAQPVDSAATTTLRSVVTTPAVGFDTLTRQKLASVSSNATTTTNIDLPYQEMVGDTGIVKSRHGSVTNDARPDKFLLCRSKSIPATMVPGPNGGFLPPNLAAVNGHRLQRSASESHDSDSDACYEDPDSVRERRRLRRAVSNDYQPATSPIVLQKEFLISQYANSIMQCDDSVFPVLAV